MGIVLFDCEFYCITKNIVKCSISSTCLFDGYLTENKKWRKKH